MLTLIISGSCTSLHAIGTNVIMWVIRYDYIPSLFFSYCSCFVFFVCFEFNNRGLGTCGWLIEMAKEIGSHNGKNLLSFGGLRSHCHSPPALVSGESLCASNTIALRLSSLYHHIYACLSMNVKVIILPIFLYCIWYGPAHFNLRDGYLFFIFQISFPSSNRAGLKEFLQVRKLFNLLPKKERRINTLGNKSYWKQRKVTVNKSIPFKDSMRKRERIQQELLNELVQGRYPNLHVLWHLPLHSIKPICMLWHYCRYSMVSFKEYAQTCMNYDLPSKNKDRGDYEIMTFSIIYAIKNQQLLFYGSVLTWLKSKITFILRSLRSISEILRKIVGHLPSFNRLEEWYWTWIGYI